MENMSFEELLADYLPEEFKTGSVLDAVITRKDTDFAFLDINNKLEGRIRAFEIEGYEIGDKISVQVIRSEEDYVIVSKLALDRIKELESYNVSDVVSGTVLKAIKGGYTVKIKNNNAFLPASLSGAKSNEIVGKTFEFLVKEKSKKGLTLSRTDLVKKEVSDYVNSLEVGQVLKGKVKQILDFGAIIELGPTTGLIHISELSWGQTKDVNSVLEVGKEVEVKIIDLDKEKSKIKLSIKQLQENPWDKVKEKYSVGQKLSGKIKEILDFGLVIEIDGSNDEGFMHVSDISSRKYFNLNRTFKVGDSIEFEIIQINDEKQRISLSAKVLLDKVWENIDDILREDDVVKGKVAYVQDYGMFVELENKLEAFIRRIDYAWSRAEAVDYKEGDEVQFVVTAVKPETKKISGSIKALVKSPWKEAVETYKVGNMVNVEITDKLENGLLVRLTERFKGLIPSRETDAEYSVGQSVDALIIDTNEAKSSIILSIKRIKENEEKAEHEELMKKYGVESKED